MRAAGRAETVAPAKASPSERAAEGAERRQAVRCAGGRRRLAQARAKRGTMPQTRTSRLCPEGRAKTTATEAKRAPPADFRTEREVTKNFVAETLEG